MYCVFIEPSGLGVFANFTLKNVKHTRFFLSYDCSCLAKHFLHDWGNFSKEEQFILKITDLHTSGHFK